MQDVQPSFEDKLSLVWNLTDRERKVLHLLLQGVRQEDLAEPLGVSPGTIRTDLARTRRVLGVDDTTAAVGVYAYWLGARGERVSAGPVDEKDVLFRFGDFECRADLITTKVQVTNDIEAVITDERYHLPPSWELPFREWQRAALERATSRGYLPYASGENTLNVIRVTRREGRNPHLKMALGRVDYITYMVLRDHFSAEPTARLATLYNLHPKALRYPWLPHPLGVGIFLVARDQPRRADRRALRRDELIVHKRSVTPDQYDERYSFTASGFGLADVDYERFSDPDSGGVQTRFDIDGAIIRKLREDRQMRFTRGELDLGEGMQYLGIVFDYAALTYDIMAFAVVDRSKVGDEDQPVDMTKGRYERIPLPRNEDDVDALARICAELMRTSQWVPSAAIGIVLLLQKRLSQRRLRKFLSQHPLSPPATSLDGG